jgi:hypothetical protein
MRSDALVAAAEAIVTALRDINCHLAKLCENQQSKPYLLSKAEAARFLGLSVESIDYYAERKQLLPYVVVSNEKRFIRDGFAEFYKELQRQGARGGRSKQ